MLKIKSISSNFKVTLTLTILKMIIWSNGVCIALIALISLHCIALHCIALAIGLDCHRIELPLNFIELVYDNLM